MASFRLCLGSVKQLDDSSWPNLSLEKWIYIVDRWGRSAFGEFDVATKAPSHQRIGCSVAMYLHFQCIDRRPILHLDIKPANILLSDSFEAKLANFGLATWIISKDNHNTTYTARGGGTSGYMAPEVPLGINSVWYVGCFQYRRCSAGDCSRTKNSLVAPQRGRQRESPVFQNWADGRRHAEIFEELDSSNAGFHHKTAEKLMIMGLQCAQGSADGETTEYAGNRS